MAIYHFSAAVRHIGFVLRVFGPPEKSIWWPLSFKKIGWNRCSCFDNMLDFIFRPFGLKMPVYVPKLAFWGIRLLKCGGISTSPTQGTSFC